MTGLKALCDECGKLRRSRELAFYGSKRLCHLCVHKQPNTKLQDQVQRFLTNERVDLSIKRSLISNS